MSASTTSTCWPRSKARCSATVSATRGARIRWTTGSSAVSRKSARSPPAAAGLEHVAYRRRIGVGEPHRHDDDLERLAGDVGLGGDLGGQLEVREAGGGEDRELLAAHERGQGVDDRDPGQDRVARHVAHGRVERRAGHRAGTVAEHRRPAVERLAHPVPDPAQPPLADGDLEGASLERDRHGSRVDARRCPGGPGPRPGRGGPRARARAGARPRPAAPWRARPSRHPRRPRPRGAAPRRRRAPWYSSGRRPGRRTGPSCAHADAVERGRAPRSRRCSTPAASSGPTSSRTRVTPDRSISSTRRRRTRPRSTSARQRS